MIGRQAINLAAFLPGTNRTSLEIFPMVIYNGQALCFAFPDNNVLSDVSMMGMIVAVSHEPLASNLLLISS